MPPTRDKSLMRSLGEALGILARAVKHDPAPERHEVRREVEESRRETAHGKAVLRRTVIEEIEFRPDERPRD